MHCTISIRPESFRSIRQSPPLPRGFLHNNIHGIVGLAAVIFIIAVLMAFAGTAFAKTDAELRAESEGFHLRYWKGDKAIVEKYAAEPDPRVQACVRDARDALAANREMLLLGGWHNTVHLLYPLGETIRNTQIMPDFRRCISAAGG